MKFTALLPFIVLTACVITFTWYWSHGEDKLVLQEVKKEKIHTENPFMRNHSIPSQAYGLNQSAHLTVPDVTYGHLHMAKTGGTSLNGKLALEFERVCGHKGYSYDFFKVNKRTILGGHKDLYYDDSSLISKFYPGYNRGRVPVPVMNEIGYEDCDWVSHETRWSIWTDIFGSWYQPLELHVPCRDSLDHLMSMCNYKKYEYNCSAPIDTEIPKCLVEINRFSKKLETQNNIRLKCFDFKLTFTGYIPYMGKRLDKKRKTAAYAKRESNKPRNRKKECIWSDKTLQTSISFYLNTHYDYWNFCKRCIGSQDDLLGDQTDFSRSNNTLG